LKSVIFILIFQFLVSGCASIINGTAETIHIRSYEQGTKLFLNQNEIGTDAAKVTIPKKDLKHSILYAKKDGCQDQFTRIETRFDSISLLGLLIDFGLISVLVVDWGFTGAVYKADKANYILTPKC